MGDGNTFTSDSNANKYTAEDVRVNYRDPRRRTPHKLLFIADAEYAQAARSTLWNYLNIQRSIPATVQIVQDFPEDVTALIVVKTIQTGSNSLALQDEINARFQFTD